ncbi:cytochrome P450 [Mastigocoleus sp. MO_188.B34]|uniref:cytochrome P450 n=1 Tax=Mastigocoleus sp. MO_188.B34 TaxID=3036635 RepID=UPI002628D541|nr:cytochrome P450 [Mastigocoleus sp. MO_188.B34]MDJ0693207.1 cytochrome P450 [Mastigocoleus sp. MO_188.B34]
MKPSNSLPDGPDMPKLLRRFKFVFQPIKYVEDFAKVYGDIFAIRGFYNDTAVIYISHPEALEQLFTTNPKNLRSASRILRFLLGDRSIILLDGEEHRRQRQLLAPPFHGERMRAYGETIRDVVEQVSNQWEMGKPFKIRGSMQEIALQVILRVVFGLDEGKRSQKLAELLNSVLESIGSPLLSAGLFFSFLQKEFGGLSPWGQMKRKLRQIDELIYELIQERRVESNQNRQDILSLMMSACDEDGQPMSDQDLHDELMTLLIAGHETTASALSWAFYWIDYLPDVREKLLKELAEQGDNLDPSIISNLPYLTAVCQETLRIHPIVMSGVLRFVTSPVEIMGYQLPVGTGIIPSIYLAHHREEVYPEPKKFKPERFLERQFSPYEFLPFGGGNRRCIGMAFALYEMKIAIATILSHYIVSRRDSRPVTPVRRGFTSAAPAGMKMVATPVSKSAKILVTK